MIVRIVLVSMLLLLAGCGIPEPAAPSVSAPTQESGMEPTTPPATTSSTDSSALAGTQWKLDSFGPDATPQTPLDDTTITMQFTDVQASGSLGCNSFSGGYTVDGQQITFSNLAQTLMACAEPINQQEQQLSAALQAVQTFARDGDTLRLVSPDGVLRFTRVAAQPAQALEGTQWQLDGIVGNDAVRSLVAGTQITALFAAGRVAGSAGCNEYTASYTLTNGVLSVGNDIATTRKACPPEVMQQEQAFLSALGATTDYAITGARLTLTHPGGQLVFMAR